MKRIVAALADGGWVTRDRARFTAAAILALTVVSLGFLLVTSTGGVDRFGRPVGTDFSSFYAAGSAVLAGQADAAYDLALHYGRQQALFGPDTPFYGWQYPPFFLIVAAALATLPYLAALGVWQAATLVLYLLALRAILIHGGKSEHTDDRLWWLIAIGFPAVFVNLGHGQNGFLSAALIGGALVSLDRRPVVAGVFFGLLAYKPQLGIMVPFALAASGRWRTFVAAAATVVALALAVTVLFGPGIWTAFLDSTGFTRTTLLEAGDPGWEKLQTVFAWARMWGASADAAYALQGAVTLVMIAALMLLWRSRARFAWQAAALAIGTVVGTPFSLDYDMMILAVAIAFLAVDGMENGFVRWQKTVMALLWLVPLIARPVATAILLPLGTITMLASFAFVVLRAPRQKR